MYRGGIVIIFFDIDWTTACWDNIGYPIFASLSLVLVIPTGMYLRVKLQEIPTDLNILINPRFISIKTGIITYMIVVGKYSKMNQIYEQFVFWLVYFP